MVKQKPLIIAIILFLLCLSSVGYTMGEYADYLNDDQNYPIVYGHMGHGYYLDLNSIYVLLRDKDIGVEFAGNVIETNIDKDYEIIRTGTYTYYESVHRSEFNTAYVKYNDSMDWKKFYVDDTHGYNELTRNTFLLCWKQIYHYDWPSSIY